MAAANMSPVILIEPGVEAVEGILDPEGVAGGCWFGPNPVTPMKGFEEVAPPLLPVAAARAAAS